MKPLGRRAKALGICAALLVVAVAVVLSLPVTERRVTHPTQRLDVVMPRYQFGERHTLRVAAPPAVVYRAILDVTAGDIRGFRALTWLRRLGRAGPPSLLNAPPAEPIVALATRTGFRRLAEDAPRELVLGALGPVTPAARAQARATLDTARAFASDAPGFAHIALSFRVVPDGRGGALLSTETRVRATDAETRRQFARYWRVIYPGSALIRRAWLAAIRRRAERAFEGGRG